MRLARVLKSVEKVVIYVNFSYLCAMDGERQILYYKSYFIDFFLSIDGGAQKKVAYVLDKNAGEAQHELREVHTRRPVRAEGEAQRQYLQSVFHLRRGKHRHAVQWISEKDAENPEQRDRQGVETKRRVL